MPLEGFHGSLIFSAWLTVGLGQVMLYPMSSTWIRPSRPDFLDFSELRILAVFHVRYTVTLSTFKTDVCANMCGICHDMFFTLV